MSVLPQDPTREELLAENAALRTKLEELRTVLKTIKTNAAGELSIRRALHGIEPTREELLEALMRPADRCDFHHGALGERCHQCGDRIDGMTKDARRQQRETIVDQVMKKGSP